jgi:hypothetical protein
VALHWIVTVSWLVACWLVACFPRSLTWLCARVCAGICVLGTLAVSGASFEGMSTRGGDKVVITGTNLGKVTRENGYVPAITGFYGPPSDPRRYSAGQCSVITINTQVSLRRVLCVSRV